MQGDTALHYAVFYTQRAVVLLLLSRGAEITARNKEVSCRLFGPSLQCDALSCMGPLTPSSGSAYGSAVEFGQRCNLQSI